MCYLWNYVLTEQCDMEIDFMIEKYYSDLAKRANNLVDTISSDSFLETLKELHGIEERCRLLIFYLKHPEWWQDASPQQMLDLIEEEYKQTYLENFLHIDELPGTSLLTLI